MLVDSHCHLNFPQFADNVQETVARAKAAGVGLMQTICTKLEDFPTIHTIALQHSAVFCSVGIHPLEVTPTTLPTPQTIADLASLPKVIGIGETGLDYYDRGTGFTPEQKSLQCQNFSAHILAAKATEQPIIVHTREAEDDTLALLKEHSSSGELRGVLHCFTGSYDFAQQCLALGFYISASGIITFKKASDLRDTFRHIPLDRLLIETDSPFLAPQKYRGQTNEPAYVHEVAQCLAEIKSISYAEVVQATYDNFLRLFPRTNS